MDTTATSPDHPIAVVGQWRKGYGRLPVPYAHAVELGGGRALVLSTFELPPSEKAPDSEDVVLGIEPDDTSWLDRCSGLLLPGGGDIDPAWYGRERHPRTHKVSHRRDAFELSLIAAALERDMPMLAICHGMQLLNVHLGGTLDQHLADDPTRLDHDRDRPRAEPVHELAIEKGTVLADIMGESTPVNSHHHQGLDEVAPGLRPIGWAEDGVLEAADMPDQTWVVGVQWHPEAMAATDPHQKRLFEAFVAAAAAYEGRALQQPHARSA